jgi:hypothetical protein
VLHNLFAIELSLVYLEQTILGQPFLFCEKLYLSTYSERVAGWKTLLYCSWPGQGLPSARVQQWGSSLHVAFFFLTGELTVIATTLLETT